MSTRWSLLLFPITLAVGVLTCHPLSPETGNGSNSNTGTGSGPGTTLFETCEAKRIDDHVVRILFVGNSLTYTNNLARLVEQFAATQGTSLRAETLAFPNYALEDHWYDGKMQAMICAGNYDAVVVQQGPSSQADGREMLLDFGKRIQSLSNSRGTQLAFFVVWPAKVNYHTFEGVIANYTEAASETNSLLCPVGHEFKRYGDAGDFWFYSADNFHPSVQGSQRAAEIIYSTLVK